MRHRRDKIEILFIILNYLAENSPAHKTKLAYVAGLNYAVLDKYLQILRKEELIEIVIYGESELVAITEKGMKIYPTFMMVLEEIGVFSDPKRLVISEKYLH